MKQVLFMVLLLGTSHHLYAQGTPNEGAKLLFGKTKSGLTAAEQNSVFKLTGFKPSADKKEFVQPGGEDYPFAAFVYPTDLNKDNVPELFIVYGNSYTSGQTGQSVMIFIKDAKGAYQAVLSTEGSTPDALATLNQGYPDLVIGGPGFEYPVMRWNGKTYDNHRIIKDAEYGKAKKLNIEDASKAYVSKL